MRILILEDDPFIALDLQWIVENDGHEVVGSFNSVFDAQEHLQDDFDYALLDVDVIGGKSFTIAGELLLRRIPFAFVSASQQSELPPHLSSVCFIPKPFEEKTIRRFIGLSSIDAPRLTI
ncbi:response regulator [Microvirga flavescens]|uniref:response regulator n=1 Tax=Microvirga flavescens TaxID=2249811 RepID=UPI001300435D|nr:response regulator [Microvirga flavescens]